ncbi:hypothetical protein F4703DRAFT_1729865 [Phycomyces blakesleeanus]
MVFHLKLFGHYTALSTYSNEDNISLRLSKEEETFLRFSSVTNMKASDVDVSRGCFRQRRYLERLKKHTDGGKEVQSIEDSTRKMASTPITFSAMVIENLHEQYKQRRKLRDFYNSAKMINQKRHVEIQQHRYCHRLFRRKRLKPKHSDSKFSSKKSLLFFTGDRGTGTIFRPKGFRMYGGKWKQKIHRETANVCITNECKTSQTCIFSFSSLINPRIPGKKEGSYKGNKGTFLCINSRCITVKKQWASKPRYAFSALAIALIALTSVMFGAAPPPFYNASQITVEYYTTITSDL